jgi:hypothetical protein
MTTSGIWYFKMLNLSIMWTIGERKFLFEWVSEFKTRKAAKGTSTCAEFMTVEWFAAHNLTVHSYLHSVHLSQKVKKIRHSARTVGRKQQAELLFILKRSLVVFQTTPKRHHTPSLTSFRRAESIWCDFRKDVKSSSYPITQRATLVVIEMTESVTRSRKAAVRIQIFLRDDFRSFLDTRIQKVFEA